MTNKVRADPMIVVSPPTANNEYNNNRQVESAFVYRLNLTPVEKLQIAVMSVTVAPIRMLAATTSTDIVACEINLPHTVRTFSYLQC